MAAIKSKQHKQKPVYVEVRVDKVYTSLEQWEQENFSSVIRRDDGTRIAEDPGALGSSISDRIFRKVEVNFLRNFQN